MRRRGSSPIFSDLPFPFRFSPWGLPVIDTSTRLLRPAELTQEVIRELDDQAARIVTDAMTRQAPGRHRAPEPQLPGERSTGPIARRPLGPEPWLPGEGPTRVMPRVVGVPLPRRVPQPLPVEATRPLTARQRLLAPLAGLLPALRGSR